MDANTDLRTDRMAIMDTVVAYATAVDTCDWPLFTRLFTPDAVWNYTAGGEQHTGPHAISARIRSAVERLDATQHFLTNHAIVVAEDTATHECYVLAQHLRGGARFLVGGRYADRLRRTEGGWLFTARTVLSTWTEGDPAVVRA